MRGNLPASGRVATGKSIGEPQDEPVREWHDYPQEKPPATAGCPVSRRSPSIGLGEWQECRRDLKLPTAMRIAQRFKAGHPMQECSDRFDDGCAAANPAFFLVGESRP